jgi:hypothetical protein
MPLPILAPPVRRWHCPNCNARDVTREVEPHTRFHPCASLGGFSAPLIEEGVDATVVVHEREDYIGREAVQMTPAGRPVMAISTEYGDGRRDVAVYAPTALGRAEA